MAESLRKLSKSGHFSKASPELQKKLQQLMKDNHLSLPKDAKEREKMLSDLKKFLKDESKKIAKSRHKEGDPEDDQEGDDSDSDNEDRDGKAGRGGATRGGGAAKLTWGDEAEANGAKFKEIILPPERRISPTRKSFHKVRPPRRSSRPPRPRAPPVEPRGPRAVAKPGIAR